MFSPWSPAFFVKALWSYRVVILEPQPRINTNVEPEWGSEMWVENSHRILILLPTVYPSTLCRAGLMIWNWEIKFHSRVLLAEITHFSNLEWEGARVIFWPVTSLCLQRGEKSQIYKKMYSIWKAGNSVLCQDKYKQTSPKTYLNLEYKQSKNRNILS